MSEIKEILNKKEEEPQKPTEVPATKPATEDITNIKTELESTQQKVAEVERRNRDLEFANKFSEIAPVYPHAKDYKDQIKAKVDAGYDIQDATFAVLGKENKLMTAEQIRSTENRNQGFGGSSTTVAPTENKPQSLEELRQAVQDMEARGEIRLS